MDKKSAKDKLSILDVRAELDNGSAVLIEMHMYGLGELKAKTIRSWARAFSEELEAGQSYTAQPPTITIAFTNGCVDPIEGNIIENNTGSIENDTAENTEEQGKIHKVCMIMDIEDFTIFTNSLELHYIDMKAFAKAVNKTGNIDGAGEAMFAKWLSVITQKEISNKDIIENAVEEEDIMEAVSALARQSEDKYVRQAYQRRQDEIYFYNKQIQEYQHREEAAELRIEQEQRRAEQAEAEIKKLRQQIAAMQADQKT